MITWGFLLLMGLQLISLSSGTNAGIKVRLTQKGLDYGRQIGIMSIQKKLRSIQLPDISGTEKVDPIGKVQYSFTGLNIVNLGLPESDIELVPGSGIKLSINNSFLNMLGNWRVRYLRIIKDSGRFDLSVSGLTISTTVQIWNDGSGRPSVNMSQCSTTVGSVSIKFHGGASWLYNLFNSFINKAVRSALQKQICPQVADAIADMNLQLKTLNVLAQVDGYAEIDNSLVDSPVVLNTSVNLGLKGEFYNIGQHQEPPFSPACFSMPLQDSRFLYMGISAFSINSAAFVYQTAGTLSLYITDDMIPSGSPIRLNTKTFGAFVPQIAKLYPGLMMKLLVETEQKPNITLTANNITVQADGRVTAYAIQPNNTLAPLFILRLEGSVSASVFVVQLKLAGNMTLNKMEMTLVKSLVGPFQVKRLDNVFMMILKFAVIPRVNARLGEGFPLPALGKMSLVKPELQLFQDFVLVGTDVEFAG